MTDRDRPESVLVDRAGEDLHDPLGQGIGGEVPVVGLAAQQHVAERPANDVRGVAVGAQDLDDVRDAGRDRPGRTSVEGIRVGQFLPRKR